MTGLRRMISALAVVAATLAMTWAAPGHAQFYKGKTISVIVGFGAGGGSDRAARFYMDYLSKHVPGNPNVVVKNMPGAGALKALNYMKETARPDGETIMLAPMLIAGELTKAEGMRFSYRDFVFLGGLSGVGGIYFVRSDAGGGIKSVGDAVKAGNLKYAGRNPTNNFDSMATLGFDLLGIDYRYVQGYTNPNKMKVALQQNEMQLGTLTGDTYMASMKKDMADTGEIFPLWADTLQGDDGKAAVPEMFGGNVPTFEEAYQQVHGKAPSGLAYEAMQHFLKVLEAGNFVLIGPPGMDPEAAKILTEAFEKVAHDPDQVAKAPASQRQVRKYVSPAHGQAAIDALGSADPKIVDFWKARVNKLAGN